MQDTPHLTQRVRDNGIACCAQQRAALRPPNPARCRRATNPRNPLPIRAQFARSRRSKPHRKHSGNPRAIARETPFDSALRAPLFEALPGRKTAPASKRPHPQNRAFFHRPYAVRTARPRPASLLRESALVQHRKCAAKSTLRTPKGARKQERRRASVTARHWLESNAGNLQERSVR